MGMVISTSRLYRGPSRNSSILTSSLKASWISFSLVSLTVARYDEYQILTLQNQDCIIQPSFAQYSLVADQLRSEDTLNGPSYPRNLTGLTSL